MYHRIKIVGIIIRLGSRLSIPHFFFFLNFVQIGQQTAGNEKVITMCKVKRLEERTKNSHDEWEHRKKNKNEKVGFIKRAIRCNLTVRLSILFLLCHSFLTYF